MGLLPEITMLCLMSLQLSIRQNLDDNNDWAFASEWNSSIVVDEIFSTVRLAKLFTPSFSLCSTSVRFLSSCPHRLVVSGRVQVACEKTAAVDAVVAVELSALPADRPTIHPLEPVNDSTLKVAN